MGFGDRGDGGGPGDHGELDIFIHDGLGDKTADGRVKADGCGDGGGAQAQSSAGQRGPDQDGCGGGENWATNNQSIYIGREEYSG